MYINSTFLWCAVLAGCLLAERILSPTNKQAQVKSHVCKTMYPFSSFYRLLFPFLPVCIFFSISFFFFFLFLFFSCRQKYRRDLRRTHERLLCQIMVYYCRRCVVVMYVVLTWFLPVSRNANSRLKPTLHLGTGLDGPTFVCWYSTQRDAIASDPTLIYSLVDLVLAFYQKNNDIDMLVGRWENSILFWRIQIVTCLQSWFSNVRELSQWKNLKSTIIIIRRIEMERVHHMTL